MFRTSLVVTVLNEEKTIKSLLQSILSQTQKPDEVIIVDGGSSDATLKKIKDERLKIKDKINLLIIQKKGNRAVGRNEAIKHAKGEIILITDAGCILDKYWVKEISKPFKDKSVDVVAGYYEGEANSVFEKCVAPYILVMPDKINPKTFLPATRSMALRKIIWENIGGFDEIFSRNEDYIFAIKLKDKGHNIYFQKSAVVHWFPPKTLYRTYTMFLRHSYGDAESRIFRPKVLLIFLRYIFFFSIVSLSSIFTWKSTLILNTCYLILNTYLVWSILKNFRYVRHWQALIWLPVIQITSDIAVMSGTVLGTLKSLRFKQLIINNKGVSLIIFAYTLIVLSGINWGIPNNNHPFNYHMDEWAQAQSVRFIFRHGSPNINGASHGAIFQYFLGGIFLIPFILLHIVNPFIIKNSLRHIEMQHRLFQILRLNTLIFGIALIITVAAISKKYLKINPVISSILVAFTPIFLLLSNYFKYDIAVAFWVGASLLFAYWYSANPSKKRLFLTSIVCALAFASKVSAIPTIAIVVASFFLFNPKPLKNIPTLFQAVGIYVAVFVFLGIPDLPFHFNEYADWWKINVQIDPNISKNLRFGMPYWAFLFYRIYPTIFGRGFILIYYLSVIFTFFLTVKYLYLKLLNLNHKRIILLTLSLFAFIISVIPLKFDASGNRMTVFIPLLALTSTILIYNVYNQLTKYFKKFSLVLFAIICTYQILACLSWVSIRIFPDLREISSKWFLDHIKPGTTIGILNPPIFEGPPDFLLKEFYEKVYFPNTKTVYKYVAYDQNTRELPDVIIMNNLEHNLKYAKDLPRNKVYFRMQKERYKLIAKFTPNFGYYRYFGDDIDFGFSGLMAVQNSISIFQKTQ